MKILLIATGLLILILIAGALGFYIGDKRRLHQLYGSNLILGVSTVAKLEGDHVDRVLRDHDVYILGGFIGLLDVPVWIIRLFTNDKMSENRIVQTVDGIEESFVRQGVEISRQEIEDVVRGRLAYTKTQ
jgi:hypothetical protein